MKAKVSLLLAGALLAACGNTANNKPHAGASSAGSASGGAGAGGSNSGGASTEDCKAALPPAALVRLTFPELSGSLANLLGEAVAKQVDEELEITHDHETFPPLASAHEGYTVTDAIFQRADLLAQRASTYVFEHFEAVTGCTEDYACVQDFVATFAERAFRRPLEDEEQSALDRVVEGAEALGAPPAEGAQYGVYAVLESPQFLYRTEFGPPAAAGTQGEVRLSDHELASALSFFLTGAAPDASLLKAAAAHDLGGSEQLAPHVERLLATPAAKSHLQAALSNYFGIASLRNVVIDDPTYNAGLASSMEHEVRKLIESHLWSKPVSALLTSRTAHVNADLATLYGVAFPPPGAALDELGFTDVQLPAERVGLITRAGMLTLRSRPDSASVVGRGLWIHALICQQAPAFPEEIPNQPTTPTNPNPTERERSEFRQETDGCKECHVEFDAYGLALDEFDAIGRYRSQDSQGRPIDVRVTLPAAAGGGEVTGGVGLSTAIAGEVFTNCLAQRFLQYAAPQSQQGNDAHTCEVDALADAGQLPADASFADLLKSVALSRGFAYRQR